MLMQGLIDEARRYRKGGVGMQRGHEVVHMAPPADLVAPHMHDLLHWLERTDAHPLVASCVFPYELEFLHPFADGNGRMGRLWQTLILREWNPVFAHVPEETVVRERQETYYEVLALADRDGNATPLVTFTLTAIRDALDEVADTEQVTGQVTEQVAALLRVMGPRAWSRTELMNALHLTHRPSFHAMYLNAAMEGGWVEPTDPGSPRSPKQCYRLTHKARAWLARSFDSRTDDA